MSTENTAGQTAQNSNLEGLSYLQIQQTLASKEASEQQAIQDRVEENYTQLNEDVKATAKSLRLAKKDRLNILKSTSVDWTRLGAKENEIESLRKGLAKLKEFRTTYFPEGSVVKVEDLED